MPNSLLHNRWVKFNEHHDEHGRFASGDGAAAVDTPAFKQWFGDSKVVDESGKPLVVYHGTTGEKYDEFRPYSHFGTAEAANQRVGTLEDFSENVVGREGGTPHVYPVYLKIENPLRMPDLASIDSNTGEPLSEDAERTEDVYPRGWESDEAVAMTLLEMEVIDIDEFDEHRSNVAAYKLLEEKGYDGIVYNNVVEDAGKDSYIIFHPGQVKSASGNRGTFDPASGDIHKDFEPDKHPRDEHGRFADEGGGTAVAEPPAESHAGGDEYQKPQDDSKSADDLMDEAEEREFDHVLVGKIMALGTTEDFKKSGYIRPDGKLADMSVRNQDYRSVDHHEFGRTAGMQEAIALGFIRYSPEANAVEMSREPNDEQYDRIWEAAARARERGEGFQVECRRGIGEWSREAGVYMTPQEGIHYRYFREPVTADAVEKTIRDFWAGDETAFRPRDRDIIVEGMKVGRCPAFKAADEAWEKAFNPDQERDERGRWAGDGHEEAASDWDEHGVESKAFKDWFGDSKIVNSDGSPKIVYHGTDKDFTQFDPEKIGTTQDYGFWGRGFYFIDKQDWANAYGEVANNGGDYTRTSEGANVMPVYLSIQNPHVWTDADEMSKPQWSVSTFSSGEHEKAMWQWSADFSERMKALGHDGIVMQGKPGNPSEYVAFYPEQIKSAHGNRGTFDPKNPNITKRFSPDQPRDEHGRWAGDGGGTAVAEMPEHETAAPSHDAAAHSGVRGEYTAPPEGATWHSIREEAKDRGFTHCDLDKLESLPTTENPMKSGFLMPSGDWVDMSEGEDERAMDHHEFGQANAHEDEVMRADGTAALQEFRALGIVRWHPETFAIDMSRELTDEQYDKVWEASQIAKERGVRFDVEMRPGAGKWSEWNGNWKHNSNEIRFHSFPSTVERDVIETQMRAYWAGKPSVFTDEVKSAAWWRKEFDEEKHPRDNRGRFASSDSGVTMTLEDARSDSKVFWHGSPSGDLRGGTTGLHVGTYKAAKQAIEARIGVPATGEWDGTREYGKTLLAGRKTLMEKDPRGDLLTGHNASPPEEDYYPDGTAKYSDGTFVPLDVKPAILAYRIVGDMHNDHETPISDEKANRRMSGKSDGDVPGWYYKEEGEDTGSIAAVVTNGSQLERVHIADAGDAVPRTRSASGNQGSFDPTILDITKGSHEEAWLKDFDEDKHPRDAHGRFATTGGGDEAKNQPTDIDKWVTLQPNDTDDRIYWLRTEINERFPEGARRNEAIDATKYTNGDMVKVAQDAEGHPIGVIRMWENPDHAREEGVPEGQYLRIRAMATARAGDGEQVFLHAVRYAVASESGLYLSSLEGSEKFYEKMGMQRGTGSTFYLTADQCKALKEATTKPECTISIIGEGEKEYRAITLPVEILERFDGRTEEIKEAKAAAKLNPGEELLLGRDRDGKLTGLAQVWEKPDYDRTSNVPSDMLMLEIQHFAIVNDMDGKLFMEKLCAHAAGMKAGLFVKENDDTYTYSFFENFEMNRGANGYYFLTPDDCRRIGKVTDKEAVVPHIEGPVRTPTPKMAVPVSGYYNFVSRMKDAGVRTFSDWEAPTEEERSLILTEVERAKEVFPQFKLDVLQFGTDAFESGSCELEFDDGRSKLEIDRRDCTTMSKLADRLGEMGTLLRQEAEIGETTKLDPLLRNLSGRDKADLLKCADERLKLAKALREGKTSEWNPVHTAYCNGEHTIAPTMRHELGHRLHGIFRDEVAKVVGMEFYSENVEARSTDDQEAKMLFAVKSQKAAEKYAITQRGRDNIAEAVAENFSAYLAGFDDHVNPELLTLFKRLEKEGHEKKGTTA